MVFINEKTEDGSWRTIDRERKVILKETFWGAPSNFAIFELKNGSKKIIFEASWGAENLGKNKGMVVRWCVYKIDQNMTKKCRPEILNLIHETLSAHGLTGNTDVVKETLVTFEPSLEGK